MSGKASSLLGQVGAPPLPLRGETWVRYRPGLVVDQPEAHAPSCLMMAGSSGTAVKMRSGSGPLTPAPSPERGRSDDA